MLKIVILAILLFILVFIPSISLAIEEDPLKGMDLKFLTEETSVDDTAKFLSISGYLESRNQFRVKAAAVAGLLFRPGLYPGFCKRLFRL
jgi:hypothetical protein